MSDHMMAAAEGGACAGAGRYRTGRRIGHRMSAPGASPVTLPCRRQGRRQPRQKAKNSTAKQQTPNRLGPVQTGRNRAAPRRSRHRRGTWNGAVPLPLPTPKSGPSILPLTMMAPRSSAYQYSASHTPNPVS